MKKNHKRVVLVGMMGSGKTTAGKIIARELGWKFIDLDEEIEKRSGTTIPIIFEREGEEGFRKRETDILRECLLLDNVLLSTGGGVVTRKENVDAINKSGSVVVYLEVSPEECFKRTRYSTRPLLQGENPQGKIEKLIVDRRPLYESVMTYRVGTDKKSSDVLAGEVVSLLNI